MFAVSLQVPFQYSQNGILYARSPIDRNKYVVLEVLKRVVAGFFAPLSCLVTWPLAILAGRCMQKKAVPEEALFISSTYFYQCRPLFPDLHTSAYERSMVRIIAYTQHYDAHLTQDRSPIGNEMRRIVNIFRGHGNRPLASSDVETIKKYLESAPKIKGIKAYEKPQGLVDQDEIFRSIKEKLWSPDWHAILVKYHQRHYVYIRYPAPYENCVDKIEKEEIVERLSVQAIASSILDPTEWGSVEYVFY